MSRLHRATIRFRISQYNRTASIKKIKYIRENKKAEQSEFVFSTYQTDKK